MPARHHFRAVKLSAHVDAQRVDGVEVVLPEVTVQLGDFVEVYPAECDSFKADGMTRHHMILEVTELFQDAAVSAWLAVLPF